MKSLTTRSKGWNSLIIVFCLFFSTHADGRRTRSAGSSSPNTLVDRRVNNDPFSHPCDRLLTQTEVDQPGFDLESDINDSPEAFEDSLFVYCIDSGVNISIQTDVEIHRNGVVLKGLGEAPEIRKVNSAGYTTFFVWGREFSMKNVVVRGYLEDFFETTIALYTGSSTIKLSNIEVYGGIEITGSVGTIEDSLFDGVTRDGFMVGRATIQHLKNTVMKSTDLYGAIIQLESRIYRAENVEFRSEGLNKPGLYISTTASIGLLRNFIVDGYPGLFLGGPDDFDCRVTGSCPIQRMEFGELINRYPAEYDICSDRSDELTYQDVVSQFTNVYCTEI